MEAKLVFYNGARLLEGPSWDEVHGALYFVAIRQNMVFRFEPETGRVTSYPTQGAVGAAVVCEEGVLEAEKSGLYFLNPDTGERHFFAHPVTEPAMRYNDAKFDPNGRFLVDVMGDLERNNCGGLYSVERNGAYRKLIAGTTVANGLGFSLDGKTLYFIDTPTRDVAAYDYDPEKGTIGSTRRVVVHIEGEGKPDGMCVDPQGRVWVALFGGGCVQRYLPDKGIMDAQISLPCRNVTSCCIGGTDKDILYITTAKRAQDDEPLAGGVFAAQLMK